MPKTASRSAPPKPTIGALEIGRFIAASMVVLNHFVPYLAHHADSPDTTIFAKIAIPGAIAVQFFFVLSAFVMMTAHRQDFGSFRAAPKFWWKRMCRIYPMYWLALCIVVPFLYGALTPSLTARLFSLAPLNTTEWVPPAWSLRYEMTFYLMFGLCLLPYIGRPLLALWFICVAWAWCPAVLLNTAHIPHPYLLVALSIHYSSYFVAPFEFYFFAGLTGGWVFSTVRVGRRSSIIALILGALTLALALPFFGWGEGYGPPPLAPITGLAFSAIILGLAGLEQEKIIQLNTFPRLLGNISYPLYILHAPLMLVLDVHTRNMKFSNSKLALLFSAGMLTLYAISAACTFLIDQPLQRLLRKAV